MAELHVFEYISSYPQIRAISIHLTDFYLCVVIQMRGTRLKLSVCTETSLLLLHQLQRGSRSCKLHLKAVFCM